jgi:hypothetical protein
MVRGVGEPVIMCREIMSSSVATPSSLVKVVFLPIVISEIQTFNHDKFPATMAGNEFLFAIEAQAMTSFLHFSRGH